jgi:CRISPR-associated protein Cmr6
MNANVGYLFYKDYFKGLNWDDASAESNKALLAEKSTAIIRTPWRAVVTNSVPITHFVLKTRAPGLLLGSGVAHEAGIENEFKLGLYFDHTSGWPYIPGSSIKGVLRSAFEHPDYISDLAKIPRSDISNLEKEIFVGIRENKELSIYKRDCFLDAYITEAPRPFLNDDYITPHKHKDREMAHLDPFVDPVPIRFLKIEPGVEFTFSFILHDSRVRDFDKMKKLELFKTILKDLGVGAKTNVGYGSLE